MSIDFRQCLYALSDVVINRPPPIRLFDQIYMKLPDMLLQAELISRWFDKKDVIFIGDGDAIGLTVTHLSKNKLLPGTLNHILVLDFDERIVNSINNFARNYKLVGKINAELYNVADPLPEKYWQSRDAFYTNPPWGASNQGKSVWAFVQRGVEAVKPLAFGAIVIGDHPEHSWTHEVLRFIQEKTICLGFRVAEMLPQFHKYHLDDTPELTSCCLILQREKLNSQVIESKPLSRDELMNFYGAEAPLKIQYIRDKTNGGKLESNDYDAEPFSIRD